MRALASLALAALLAAPVRAQQAPAAIDDDDDELLEEAAAAAASNPTAAPGYSPATAAAATPALRINGYIDIGFARAQGDGTSFPAGDERLPADYGVDTFAPMVNSRGDVASTNAGGRFTNGFLPHTVNIGGRASFLINTVDLDIRYAPSDWPVLLFARTQLLPRFNSSDGEGTRVLVEQAFARVQPFAGQELMLFAGKLDSVFGVEYLENEANLRTGVTPSLLARYTTGQPLGVKAFYRLQITPLWSAISLNVAATNGGTLVDTLQPQSASLTGVPVVSGRLGVEVNLRKVELKLGGSAFYGPRNDQHNQDVAQRGFGADARLILGWLALTGEWVKIDQFAGAGDKDNGLGQQTAVSGFHADGYYGTAALALPVELGALKKITPYGRYSRRHAQFEGFTPITVDAVAAGLRIDIFDSLALKGEALFNRELEGAPQVPNNVYTSSLVLSF